jgi:5-methylthioadenosine/S-adenosylhomocysteine deaminase
MDKADLIVDARWVIPGEPTGTVLDDHAVVVRDGRILAVLPQADARAQFTADERHARHHHILMPGLVNAHTHAAMSLLRGLADDLPLGAWLGRHIWPAESRWVSADFVRDGTELALLEMLRGGTTCFQDMYYFPDIVAQTAIEIGIRAVVGMIVIEQPTVWAADPEQYLSRGLAVHDRFRGNPLVRTAFAPHAPYTVSDTTLERIRVLADELGVHVHMHVHETADEISAAVNDTGRRPLQRLDDLGLLNAQLAAVHMTDLLDEEIGLLATRGVSVIHCPESNLKLASGFCRVADLHRAGVNVALGTDGAGSNNDLDMLGEMRSGALLAKGVAGDAAALTAADAFTMATMGGARALGWADEIGSLQIGKCADLVAVDLRAPATQPVYHPLSQLVYAASRDQVSDVWVNGQPRLRDGAFVGVDPAPLYERVDGWRRRIAATDPDVR